MDIYDSALDQNCAIFDESKERPTRGKQCDSRFHDGGKGGNVVKKEVLLFVTKPNGDQKAPKIQVLPFE